MSRIEVGAVKARPLVEVWCPEREFAEIRFRDTNKLFIAVLELTWSDGCDWEWIWEIKGLGRRGASKSRLGAKAAIRRAIRKHGGEETS